MLTDLYNTFFYCYVFQGRTTINISDGITVKDEGILISATDLQLKKVKKGTFVIWLDNTNLVAFLQTSKTLSPIDMTESDKTILDILVQV